MAQKTKLELTWIGKENRPKLEPRVLLEDPEKSYHAAHRVTENDLFDNRLIFGDNLLALKALEQEFTGRIKCIYIDPPYNTGSAFEHYDDGIEHSIWLSMMRDRLEILAKLLAPDGAIFVQVDDNEGQYLRVMMDEVLGRQNFVATFVWRKVDSPNDNKVFITPDHEYIFCFAKDITRVSFNRKIDPTLLEAYGQRDETGRLYRDRLLKKNGKNSMREDRPSMFFSLRAPNGDEVFPIHDDGKEACWAMGKDSIEALAAAGDLIWKNRGTSSAPKWIPYSREYAPASPERPYPTIWEDLHTSRQAKAHQKEVLAGVPLFDTPKPEPLIERILRLSTNPGDWVLDSFGGSGTTGAVSHKMGRRWLMVELGEHCHTHILPRLKKVVDGADLGGVTEAVGWKGGGGFRYFRLAPSLLTQDKWGQWVISKEYNAPMLAEAVCKLEGFTYAPSDSVYWQHGKSTERDFLYVTTANLSHDQLQQLSDEVGSERSLLVVCSAFRGRKEGYPNLTVKKIPKAVLSRCEWGHDDYSLKVENLPKAPPAPPKVDKQGQQSLFGEEVGQ
ncbi:MAG: site-specific DNA-methyltransferase [Dechloromonas sp.]|nr:MAG: site-specific DNA-methyltransferase [Dechloromonas sp.]